MLGIHWVQTLAEHAVAEQSVSGIPIGNRRNQKKVADLADEFTGTILPAFTNHFSRVKHNENEEIVKKNKTGGAICRIRPSPGYDRSSPPPF
jgi:hypothetical protein